jgi:hypothetical protein
MIWGKRESAVTIRGSCLLGLDGVPQKQKLRDSERERK